MQVSSSLSDDLVVRLRAAGCVFAEEEAALLIDAAVTDVQLERMLESRVGGKPLEQVLGWAEFAGLRIIVEPNVFVPRLRTELLVTEALRRVRPGHLVVDLCCGSGAVAAALESGQPEARVIAADIDPAAVACARRNVVGPVLEGDLFDALPAAIHGRIDVLVASPPYVPTDGIRTMPPEARDHEPRVALDGGPDGMSILRRLTEHAGEWLAPGGSVLLETSFSEAETIAALLERAGLLAGIARDDERDATVVMGTAVMGELPSS
jgi:release factor glutamine methyltransferase